MLDTRYIYLGKTTANPRLIKIGLAKDVQDRWAYIDRSVKGSMEYPIVFFRVINAASLEHRLKQKYRNRRKQFKGSGKTEWFELGFFARLWLLLIVAAHGVLAFVCAVLVGLAVVGFVVGLLI